MTRAGSERLPSKDSSVPARRAMMSHSRLPVLDGLRAVSIILVLAAHMTPLGPKWLRLNETAGAMGMSLFFALSGFLIVSGLRSNPNVTEFLIRRFTRIVPLAYAYVIIVFAVMKFQPAALIWTASFVVNYMPQYLNSYNAHFWSLCVEMQFYFSIAFALAIFGKRGLSAVWPACFAITALRIFGHEYAAIQTHFRADEILIGGCLAMLYRPQWRTSARSGSIVVMLLVFFWFAASNPFFGWCQYFRAYATAGLVAALLRNQDGRCATVLSSSLLRYVATISYALYIIHPLTVAGWLNEGGPLQRYLVKRPISFLMTFFAAHFSTFYWERYWLQAGKQWIAHRRLRRAQAGAW